MESPTPVPLGLYDHEDDTPGVSSLRVPDGQVSQLLYGGTNFVERLDDLLPGSASTWFKILRP